ncbi:MAG: hypothetical protein EPN84_03575 [Legionella sp.]|nr:MAG: hypothetical protein EPN84_03575 [Legionella sp.]
MAEETKAVGDLSQWVSTYGLITAERILGRYQIHLPQNELLAALKYPFNFYHKTLKVPLKNVLNGIVFQQALDYHIYAQKLFVDYLLSGESAKEADSQGASTRASMEDERQRLILLGEEFQKSKKDHEILIATSQADLIRTCKEWNTAFEKAAKGVHSLGFVQNLSIDSVKSAINHAMIHCDLAGFSNDQYFVIDSMNEILKLNLNEEQKIKINDQLTDLIKISLDFEGTIDPYINQSEVICVQANSFRTQFYDTIIRVMGLINLLSDYRLNEIQDQINREPLYFDRDIGKL